MHEIKKEEYKKQVLSFFSKNITSGPARVKEEFKLKTKIIKEYPNGLKKVQYFKGDLILFEVHEE